MSGANEVLHGELGVPHLDRGDTEDEHGDEDDGVPPLGDLRGLSGVALFAPLSAGELQLLQAHDSGALAEAEGEMRGTETARSGDGARGWPQIIYTKGSTHRMPDSDSASHDVHHKGVDAPPQRRLVSVVSAPLPIAPSQRRRVAVSSQVIACSTRREVEDGKHNDKGDKKRWCKSKHPPAGVTPRGRPAACASRRDRVQICLRKKRNACVMVLVMEAKRGRSCDVWVSDGSEGRGGGRGSGRRWVGWHREGERKRWEEERRGRGGKRSGQVEGEWDKVGYDGERGHGRRQGREGSEQTISLRGWRRRRRGQRRRRRGPDLQRVRNVRKEERHAFRVLCGEPLTSKRERRNKTRTSAPSAAPPTSSPRSPPTPTSPRYLVHHQHLRAALAVFPLPLSRRPPRRATSTPSTSPTDRSGVRGGSSPRDDWDDCESEKRDVVDLLVAVVIVERLEFFECVRPWPFACRGPWRAAARSRRTLGPRDRTPRRWARSAAMMERLTPCTPSRMPLSTAAFVGSRALRAAAGVRGCEKALEDGDAELELEAK
ncbi:hypothetical protein B0H14DRAFT_2627780 [Mycena olivaceomarginata]|nr:hypothetical protein B0H14DRAFT_2627780 [Mycena olivaceomarginata]